MLLCIKHWEWSSLLYPTRIQIPFRTLKCMPSGRILLLFVALWLMQYSYTYTFKFITERRETLWYDPREKESVRYLCLYRQSCWVYFHVRSRFRLKNAVMLLDGIEWCIHTTGCCDCVYWLFRFLYRASINYSGCIDRWVDGRTEGGTDRWMGWMDGWTEGGIGWIGWMGWTEGRMRGWMDRRTDGLDWIEWIWIAKLVENMLEVISRILCVRTYYSVIQLEWLKSHKNGDGSPVQIRMKWFPNVIQMHHCCPCFFDSKLMKTAFLFLSFGSTDQCFHALTIFCFRYLVCRDLVGPLGRGIIPP